MGFPDLLTLLSLVIVVTIHEFSHAWTANFLGDPTARLAGRISLNPLRHLDPVGTLMIFLVHLGWGKPVPVNPHYFKNPVRDEAITALAGPLSNLILAIVVAVPYKYMGHMMAAGVADFLETLLAASIYLFAFNMLPFPPLDGSKFLGWFIPRRFSSVYEQYLARGSVYFLIFVLVDQFFLGRYFGFSLLQYFLGTVFVWIQTLIYLGT